MDERIEYIKNLQENGYKHEPSQSSVIGNFYAIITIIAVTLSILYYVNYIQPTIKAKATKELNSKKHQEFLDERARRIALSHKLNGKDFNDTK